jgi:hypothetical protein
MGLPVGKLICASNCNDVLTDFLRTGVYDRNRPFHTTMSPSMDILISSNLERLLFDLSGENDAEVRRYMDALAATGRYEVSDAIKKALAEQYWGGFCDEAGTTAAIAKYYKDCGYLIDTHTAVAASVMEQYRAASGDKTPTVFVSTASPYKFCDSVLTAIGQTPAGDGVELLDQLHDVTGTAVPRRLAALRGKARRFDLTCEKPGIGRRGAGLPEIRDPHGGRGAYGPLCHRGPAPVLTADKSMEVFGPAWENYVSRIEASLGQLTAGDVLILAGDTSWGIDLPQAEADFRFLDQFPLQEVPHQGQPRLLVVHGVQDEELFRRERASPPWTFSTTTAPSMETTPSAAPGGGSWRRTRSPQCQGLEPGGGTAGGIPPGGGGAAHLLLPPLSAPVPGLSVPGDPGGAGAIPGGAVLLRPPPRTHHQAKDGGHPGADGVLPDLRGPSGVCS